MCNGIVYLVLSVSCVDLYLAGWSVRHDCQMPIGIPIVDVPVSAVNDSIQLDHNLLSIDIVKLTRIVQHSRLEGPRDVRTIFKMKMAPIPSKSSQNRSP